MKIVFMGTPEIAKTALGRLINSRHEIVAVYTRQDKPVGRKQVLTPSPVKQLAEENGLRVIQPKTFKAGDAAQEFAALKPDIAVVVAYGLILPQAVLSAPKYGCINLHVSLLPNYRGAAPVQWAIINGEEKTGVSIMQMDEGIDTGDVLSEQEIDILPNITSGELLQTSAEIGGELLLQTLEQIEKGTVVPVPQKGEGAHAPMLSKQMAVVNFDKPAQQLHNLVRGCNPWPLAWFEFGKENKKRVKLLKTSVVKQSGASGTVLSTKPLIVACGKDALCLERLVPEGSKEMDGSQWALGRRFEYGEKVYD